MGQIRFTVRNSVRRALVLLILWAFLNVCGCGYLPDTRCGAPLVSPPDDSLSPIQKALHFLRTTQLETDQLIINRMDYAGDWPQCFAFGERAPYFRDASPFMATFIHRSLTLVREENRVALGLTDQDVDVARSMRRRAVDLMMRFRAPDSCPDAGAFGFWPHQPAVRLPHDLLLAAFYDMVLPGPRFLGQRAPVNLPFFPPRLNIPADADVTATVYATLLDHAALDGGAAVPELIPRFFADWRDLGAVPRRNNPAWLAPNTGAFLTWLAYHDDPSQPTPNDVDIVVNANVLYALGRLGRLDTPGADEAIALINQAIQAGVHRTSPRTIAVHYPDNLMLHFAVARAWRLGGVTGLRPAVELLVDDLLDSVESGVGGLRFWNRNDPELNTALGALALMMGGEFGPDTDGAIQYLLARQDSDSGSWNAGVFFHAQFDNGLIVGWVSAPLTTALALEALATHQLGVAAAREQN